MCKSPCSTDTAACVLLLSQLCRAQHRLNFCLFLPFLCDGCKKLGLWQPSSFKALPRRCLLHTLASQRGPWSKAGGFAMGYGWDLALRTTPKQILWLTLMQTPLQTDLLLHDLLPSCMIWKHEAILPCNCGMWSLLAPRA